MTALPDDPTLDEIRAYLAPRLPAHTAFDGWTPAAVDSAASEAGIDPGIARLAFPGGAIDMIDAWFASIDARMADALPVEKLAAMKVRARIRALITTRLDIVRPDREALRRALSILSMPLNLPKAARLGWRSADLMWQLAGDTATDYNHYSKRLTLSAVYGSTILIFLDDESEGFQETEAFLDRRIDNVMQFEKAKAQFTARREHLPSLSRFIGRLRYPAV